MKVAIDARKLHDFGIGTYIRNLLRHLARLDQENEYVLLCHEPDMDVATSLGPNFRTVSEPSRNYSVREQFHIPWVLMREKPDVFHAPHYVLPVAIRCRSVVTIHDCIHLMFPQYLPNRAAYVVRSSGDVERGEALGSDPDGLGGIQARHSPFLQRAAREDLGGVQRHRRAVLDRAGRGGGPTRARAVPARSWVRALRRQRSSRTRTSSG